MTMQPPVPPPGQNRPDRIEELGVYEMIWDCKYCGTANLPALSHKFCPNCGAAQDPDTRRFPSDAEKIAVRDYKARGASLVCPACSTPNLGDSHFCLQCGAPLDKAAQAKTLGSEVRAQDAAFQAGQQRDLAQERLAADLAPARKPAKSNPVPIVAAIVIGLLLCGGLIFLLTAQRPASVVVEGHTWERIIYVEQFSRVSDNAWDEQVPADAYGVSCSERQRDTRQVPDGERCEVRRIDNGDGTFREQNECYTLYRDEPIYDRGRGQRQQPKPGTAVAHGQPDDGKRAGRGTRGGQAGALFCDPDDRRGRLYVRGERGGLAGRQHRAPL
jgi:hypothetical protein